MSCVELAASVSTAPSVFTRSPRGKLDSAASWCGGSDLGGDDIGDVSRLSGTSREIFTCLTKRLDIHTILSGTKLGRSSVGAKAYSTNKKLNETDAHLLKGHIKAVVREHQQIRFVVLNVKKVMLLKTYLKLKEVISDMLS